METLSPEDVADQLGVHPTFVRKQARLGAWPHHRVGRRIRFTPKQVQVILGLTERGPAGRASAPSRERLTAVGVTQQSAARQRRPVTGAALRPPGA